jgi:Glycosyl hydrolase family 26
VSPNRPDRAAPVPGWNGLAIRRGRSAAFAALAVVAALGLAACSGSGSGPSSLLPTSTASGLPGPTASVQTYTVAHGPQPPADGAWVGAWVKPPKESILGRVAAVDAFQEATGTKLPLVQVYHPWAQDFPDENDKAFVGQGKTLLISWNGQDSAKVAAGAYDDVLRQRAEALKALGKPVLLRWRWEMNRPNIAQTVGTPAQYVAAWKHVHAVFEQAGATNVGFVWCPLASNFASTDAAAYYPGDDQVDWLCTDVYAIGNNNSFGDVASDFMTWAATKDKPVMIGEYGAQQSDPAAKAAWIAGATAYALAHPQIRAMVYFDADRVDDHGVPRDFRVEADPTVLQAYRTMLATPWFDPKS